MGITSAKDTGSTNRPPNSVPWNKGTAGTPSVRLAASGRGSLAAVAESASCLLHAFMPETGDRRLLSPT